jgi:alkylhydroperoxidase/carboxymuconolactone decarboxylase family protein YurZ
MLDWQGGSERRTLRQVEELKVHVGVALSNGLTVREIEEVLYQSIPYVGFPAANSAKVAMIEALQSLQSQSTGGAAT